MEELMGAVFVAACAIWIGLELGGTWLKVQRDHWRLTHPGPYQGPEFKELKRKLEGLKQDQKTFWDGGFGGGAQ